MKNTIQTFRKFHQGQICPNRKNLMRNCGFVYKGTYLIEPPFTPKIQAEELAESYNASKGAACHVVYWLGEKNMDGLQGYQYWIKELVTGELSSALQHDAKAPSLCDLVAVARAVVEERADHLALQMSVINKIANGEELSLDEVFAQR